MKKLLLFISLLLCGQLNAQTDSSCTVVMGVTGISGKINVDLHVQLYKDKSLTKEVITKGSRCTLAIPEAGKYNVVVKSDTYLTKVKELELSCGQNVMPYIVLAPKKLAPMVNFEDSINKEEAIHIAKYYWNREEFTVGETTYRGKEVWECSYGYTNKIEVEGVPVIKKPQDRYLSKRERKEPEKTYMTSSGSRSIYIDKVTGQVVHNGGYVTR